MDKNYYVYRHTSPSNKIYIGITCRKPEARWANGKGYLGNKHFASAIQKYGWDNFKHEILFENLTKEEACQKEIELIAFYKSNDREFGYNISSGGEHGCKGYHHSEEARKRMSELALGKNTWMRGRECPKETRQKISESNKKVVHTKEWNEKISKNRKGIKCSEEAKRKISKGNTGKVRTDEVKQRISKTLKGRTLSEEDKAKKSKAAQERAKAYKEYKVNGGLLGWNKFSKEYTNLKN